MRETGGKCKTGSKKTVLDNHKRYECFAVVDNLKREKLRENGCKKRKEAERKRRYKLKSMSNKIQKQRENGGYNAKVADMSG